MMEINWVGEILDTIVSLNSKWARWLNARGKKFCFVIWAAAATYWFFRDIYLGLYSQAFFCLFSIWLNMYGYFNWKKKKIGETV